MRRHEMPSPAGGPFSRAAGLRTTAGRGALCALLAAALFAGCIQSLHPLYSRKTLVLDAGVPGVWSEPGGRDTWSFSEAPDSGYRLVYTEKDEKAEFAVHMVALGKLRFFDFFPKEPELKNSFYKGHLLPCHTFARVWVEGDTLRFAMLDPAWLKSMLDKKRVSLRHETVEGQTVLSASTRDLQRFLGTYAGGRDAFPRPKVLVRRQ